MLVPFVDLKREANICLKEILKSTEKVIKSGHYINGPNVYELEKKLKEFLNVKHVITLGNGSDGLTFILKSIGIKEGDEVICPANSFIASSWSIKAAGAKPVFCDVLDDLLLDPIDFEKKITKKTKAVMPVHLTGRVFNTNRIEKICYLNNIKIIEDAAQSFGATNANNKKAGSLGIAASFSMHPLKNLAVYGDGGFISTSDDNVAEQIKLLRNHGLKNRDESKIWGFNSRLDEIQASYALIKLKYIKTWTTQYIKIAKKYSEELHPIIKKPLMRDDYIDVYHNYVIQVNEKYRDKLMSDLDDCGIQTKIHYPIPLHLQECASDLGYIKGDIPNVEKLSKEMISLPIYPCLEKYEQDYVIEKINNILETY